MSDPGSQPPALSAGKEAAESEELSRMTLMGHLEELRRRIFASLITFVAAFFACWYFAKPIYRFLARPVMEVLPPGKKLVFLTVTEPFFLYMKVAALAAVFVSSPYLLFQIWRFVAPGLYRHERRYSFPFILFGSTFFLAGGLFAYYVAFPFAIEFLVGYGTDFEPAITGRSYFSFLLTVILGLGLMFELPIFIFLFTQIGLVTPAFLMRHFRWAVIIIFIAAAIITPTPDVVNLSLFAVPTVLLYLLGVAASTVVTWKRRSLRILMATIVALLLSIAALAVYLFVRPPLPAPQMPVCEVPLAGGAPALAGLWELDRHEGVAAYLRSLAGRPGWRAYLESRLLLLNRVERIEQCGLGVAITGNRGWRWSSQAFHADAIAETPVDDLFGGTTSRPATARYRAGGLEVAAEIADAPLDVRREIVDGEMVLSVRHEALPEPMRLIFVRDTPLHATVP